MKKGLIYLLPVFVVLLSSQTQTLFSHKNASSQAGGLGMSDNNHVISKIRTVAVNVSEHDKAYDFYVNKLNFEVISDQITENGYFWLMVAPQGSDTPIALAPPPPGKEVGGFSQIVLQRMTSKHLIEK